MREEEFYAVEEGPSISLHAISGRYNSRTMKVNPRLIGETIYPTIYGCHWRSSSEAGGMC